MCPQKTLRTPRRCQMLLLLKSIAPASSRLSKIPVRRKEEINSLGHWTVKSENWTRQLERKPTIYLQRLIKKWNLQPIPFTKRTVNLQCRLTVTWAANQRLLIKKEKMCTDHFRKTQVISPNQLAAYLPHWATLLRRELSTT